MLPKGPSDEEPEGLMTAQAPLILFPTTPAPTTPPPSGPWLDICWWCPVVFGAPDWTFPLPFPFPPLTATHNSTGTPGGASVSFFFV